MAYRESELVQVHHKVSGQDFQTVVECCRAVVTAARTRTRPYTDAVLAHDNCDCKAWRPSYIDVDHQKDLLLCQLCDYETTLCCRVAYDDSSPLVSSKREPGIAGCMWEQEAQKFHFLSKSCASVPSFLGAFINGYVYEWVEGAPPTVCEFITPQVQAATGRAMARFHNADVPQSVGTNFSSHSRLLADDKASLRCVRTWLDVSKRSDKVASLLKDYQFCEDVGQLFSFLEQRADQTHRDGASLIRAWTDHQCDRSSIPALGFAHCNLGRRNTVLKPDGEIAIIDFEFSCYDRKAMDIAFVVMAVGVYRNQGSGFAWQMSVFVEQLKEIATAYVDEHLRLKGSNGKECEACSECEHREGTPVHIALRDGLVAAICMNGPFAEVLQLCFELRLVADGLADQGSGYQRKNLVDSIRKQLAVVKSRTPPCK